VGQFLTDWLLAGKKGTLTVATHTGLDIHHDDPTPVIDAIRRTVLSDTRR
jgi:hypothetical protein